MLFRFKSSVPDSNIGTVPKLARLGYPLSNMDILTPTETDKIETRLDNIEEDIEVIKEDSQITREVTNDIGEWVDYYFHEDKSIFTTLDFKSEMSFSILSSLLFIGSTSFLIKVAIA